MRPDRAGVRFSPRMRVRLSTVFSLVLVACAPVPDEPAPEPPPPPVASSEAPATGALPWRWVHDARDGEFPEVREVVAGSARYQFLAEQHRVRIIETGEKGLQWSFELPRQGLDGGFLLLVGSRLYVAHHSHIASGARVYALNAETGALVWQADVHGLGPVDHSKYRNRVQLGADAEALFVYGHEAQGRYVEALDLETGKMLSNARVDDALAEIPWSFSLPEEAWPESVDGQATASATLGKTLFEVRYNVIASGAHLHAEGPGGRWDVPLEGLGPIGHSEYFNAVEVRAEPGKIVVYGREAAGKYIEVRDPVAGRLLSNVRFF